MSDQRLGARAFRTLATIVFLGAIFTAAPVEASAATCQTWGGAQPENVGVGNNILQGVDATSSCNAWAVGYYSNGAHSQTLIEHWNGTSWKLVPSPNPGGSTHDNVLAGVAAISSSNAWAVGHFFNDTAAQTLVLHWNGSSWKQVPSPNPGGSSLTDALFGVAASSSSNAWAVGYFGNPAQTLILRWNGTAWKRVTSPKVGVQLFDVAATSSSNAWAVGYLFNGTADKTLIFRWNGTAWKKVASPNAGGASAQNFLKGVAATSSSSAWGVGYYWNGTADQTLILHWNGVSWKRQTSVNPGGSTHDNVLAGVAATSRINSWAVGYYSNGTASQTLIEHWNGTSWKQQASPNPSSQGNDLAGVTANSSSNAWAVGTYIEGGVNQTLAVHCC